MININLLYNLKTFALYVNNTYVKIINKINTVGNRMNLAVLI